MHSPELAQFYYDTKDELRNFSKNSFAFSRDFRNCFAICDLRGVNSDLEMTILLLQIRLDSEWIGKSLQFLVCNQSLGIHKTKVQAAMLVKDTIPNKGS